MHCLSKQNTGEGEMEKRYFCWLSGKCGFFRNFYCFPWIGNPGNYCAYFFCIRITNEKLRSWFLSFVLTVRIISDLQWCQLGRTWRWGGSHWAPPSPPATASRGGTPPPTGSPSIRWGAAWPTHRWASRKILFQDSDVCKGNPTAHKHRKNKILRSQNIKESLTHYLWQIKTPLTSLLIRIFVSNNLLSENNFGTEKTLKILGFYNIWGIKEKFEWKSHFEPIFCREDNYWLDIFSCLLQPSRLFERVYYSENPKSVQVLCQHVRHNLYPSPCISTVCKD